MQLTMADWVVVLGYGFIVLAVGLYFARRAGRGHRRVLPRRPETSLVASGHLHGGHHLLHRHAEPGHGHGPDRRGESELALVGVRHHRNVHGVLLREALAEVRGPHGHGLLRTSVFGKACRLPARFPGPLSGGVLQRHDHGHRDSGGHQDRWGAPGGGEVRGRAVWPGR